MTTPAQIAALDRGRIAAKLALTLHGMSKTPTHISWSEMIRRCTDPRRNNYHRYGGRGIGVCERWMDFRNFLSDMGVRPEGTSLDRTNSDGNYEPGNCRWSGISVQANNTRTNRRYVISGESLTVAEWASRFSLPYSRVYLRLRRGWTIEKALGVQ